MPFFSGSLNITGSINNNGPFTLSGSLFTSGSVINNGSAQFLNLPTSSTGLATGSLWVSGSGQFAGNTSGYLMIKT
jgi:hypothetical protein